MAQWLGMQNLKFIRLKAYARIWFGSINSFDCFPVYAYFIACPTVNL